MAKVSKKKKSKDKKVKAELSQRQTQQSSVVSSSNRVDESALQQLPKDETSGKIGKIMEKMLNKASDMPYFLGGHMTGLITSGKNYYSLPKMVNRRGKEVIIPKIAIDKLVTLVFSLFKDNVPLHIFTEQMSEHVQKVIQIDAAKQMKVEPEKELNNFSTEKPSFPSDESQNASKTKVIDLKEKILNIKTLYPELNNCPLLCKIGALHNAILMPVAVMMAFKVREKLLHFEDEHEKSSLALFVMLTTLENNCVAVFVGRCSANWQAYLLGVVPNAHLTEKSKIGNSNSNSNSSLLSKGALSQLNDTAQTAFFCAMAQIFLTKLEISIGYFSKYVKVLLHDDRLTDAASQITNAFIEYGKNQPIMLPLLSVTSIIQPMVAKICKRFISNKSSQNASIIPFKARFLLQSIVPTFIHYNYPNWCSLESLTSPPQNLMREVTKANLSKNERDAAKSFEKTGSCSISLNENLIEWIVFALEHFDHIKAYVLEQLKEEKEEKKTSDNQKECRLIEGIQKVLGVPKEDIPQLINDCKSELNVVSKQLAPLIELHQLLHGKTLQGLTVNGFLGRLQHLKVKYQSSKKVKNQQHKQKNEQITDNDENRGNEGDSTATTDWPVWPSCLFEEIQAALNSDSSSFSLYRKTLRTLKQQYENQLSEPSTSTSPNPTQFHLLLDTVPLVAFDLSHLPSLFPMELSQMAELERLSHVNDKGILDGYTSAMAMVYFNKQWIEPEMPSYDFYNETSEKALSEEELKKKQEEEERLKAGNKFDAMIDMSLKKDL